MGAFFSVIIPVYKVEEYLPECVDSVLSQTFSDFEIILVDDGSPDNCPALCDEYAKKDPRVHVVHKQNGGLSSARNAGMEVAKGKYITFLDSDDYWYSDTVLQALYGVISSCDSDVVVTKRVKLYNGELSKSSDFCHADLESADYIPRLTQLIDAQLYDCCAYDKAFKRSLAVSNDLTFTHGVLSEDIDWVARLCMCANSIDIMNSTMYVYRKGREGSITYSVSDKHVNDYALNIMRSMEYPQLETKSDAFKSAYYGYLSYLYVQWMAYYSQAKEKSVEIYDKMLKYKFLINYGNNKKVVLTRCVMKLCGFKITSKLLGLYLKKNSFK